MDEPRAVDRSNGRDATSDPARYVVAVVASSGGLSALTHILTSLPAGFPAAIAIVLHIQPDRKSQVAEILTTKGPLRVLQAQGGEVLSAGTVYVAQPNRHLVILPGGILSLTDTAREHNSRPAGDPLFASLAEQYGPRGIAIVLTGFDSDGARGIKLVKAAGGRTIAQDEATSQQFSMPRSSIATGDIDAILPLDEIAPALIRMVK